MAADAAHPLATVHHTVPKAAHISEKYLGVYMGESPLAGKFPKAVLLFSLRKFPKAFNPNPFGNFQEIQRRKKNVALAGFDPLPF